MTQSDLRGSRRDALKWFALAGAAAALPHSAHADEPPPAAAPAIQGAGFYKFKAGGLDCALVSDGGFPMEPASLMPKADPAELARTAAAAFVSTAAVAGQVNVLAVRTADGVALVDTGCGALFGPTTGKLVENLARLGYGPANVRTIVLTHAHPDHIGGLAAFPAAEVVMTQTEHDFWTGAAEMPASLLPADFRRSMTETARKLIASAKDRLKLVASDAELPCGLTLVPAPGHTPGHVAVRLGKGADAGLYLADALHLAPFQLAHPEWHVAYDADPELAAKTRAAILERAAADRTAVSGSHLAFPAQGHLAKAATGYTWVPAVWEW